MRAIRKLALASLIAAMSIAASAGGALADSRMFVAHLYGGNEVPAAGDPNAFGIATVVRFNATVLCYSIILVNAAGATAAHIHPGAAGVAGAPIVTLPVGAAVTIRNAGCVGGLAAATVAAIRANPQNFYVNVHNAAFPGGAARGQLQ